ncbi:TRAP transporter small permease subunit [Yanghanlia caeni]|uniref:TRAP transporter small permease protein n=1 Tax=Yanghanlia caeni TaxID=3064283 RepID=A0ABU1D6H2_9BURK|nr:TRAP transporter small permease subunit [Alcaligenaceae bacterium LG-2]NGR09621.1 TRAP transporter small permease subunit [bacterium SGD-2]
MQKLLLTIDSVNTKLGQLFGWLVLALTLFVTYEVVSRYLFSSPHAWAFDAMNMMYGTLFMMAGAYTLSKNGHVRGDVLYGFFPPRLQAGLDLALYILFFFPGVIALCWAGYYYFEESFVIRETSSLTTDGPPLYPFKAVIPIAGITLLFQGFVECVYCVACLKQGDWPSRDKDVEEVDLDKLKDMVHADDITGEPGSATPNTQR